MKSELFEAVSEELGKIFKKMGYTINVDETYLTSVVINDQGEQVVDYSKSLSWAIMEKVQTDEFPAFDDTYAGVFFKQWTFDPAYRIVELDMIDINHVGRLVVESFRK
ncbi:DUF3848 domain-containing protein [Pseudomonas sp. IT-P253]|jgi:hypothetical protein|uniref:hypothetical protein n=1 Tax=Pseudomonas sp. IT-P253 TaxID=3026455 RepID=UPI0039DF719A